MDKISIKIVDEKSASYAATKALLLAEEIGFSKLDCSLIATAVSEITTNIFRYAEFGQMDVRTSKNGSGIEIRIMDTGPGIANKEMAMVDGFSSDSTSLGVGLGAARRAMDYFNINSNSEGTIVEMCKWLPKSNSKFQFGYYTLADNHYLVNGDGYIINEFYNDSVLIGIIDGLGEGKNAYNTTKLLKEVISKESLTPLDEIIKICESKIKNNFPDSGAALALLRVSPNNLEYAGIGDTFTKIFPSNINFNSQPGIVGCFKLPAIRVRNKANSEDRTIVLCTDGIKEHFNEIDIPLDSHAQNIAETIITNYRRDFGDATVLVIKIKK